MTADTISTNPDLFERAVASLTQRPSFMAHLLSVAFAGDVSTARLVAELDCAPASAIRLALMRVPRNDRKMFREDVDRISEAAGVDRMLLLAIIRQAQSLIAFGVDGSANDQQGMLLAARDVVQRSDDQED